MCPPRTCENELLQGELERQRNWKRILGEKASHSGGQGRPVWSGGLKPSNLKLFSKINFHPGRPTESTPGSRGGRLDKEEWVPLWRDCQRTGNRKNSKEKKNTNTDSQKVSNSKNSLDSKSWDFWPDRFVWKPNLKPWLRPSKRRRRNTRSRSSRSDQATLLWQNLTFCLLQVSQLQSENLQLISYKRQVILQFHHRMPQGVTGGVRHIQLTGNHPLRG